MAKNGEKKKKKKKKNKDKKQISKSLITMHAKVFGGSVLISPMFLDVYQKIRWNDGGKKNG